MKCCSTCKVEKELIAFGNHKCNKDGLRYSCKECEKIYGALYHKKYPERRVETNKKSKLKRKDRNRTLYRIWETNEIATNIEYRLKKALRVRLSDIITKGLRKGSAVRDLGCDSTQFKKYLESRFTEGMTWDNWGNRRGCWSIDHIMPLSAFNLQDRQHFLLANYYLNLRPLWWVENIRKRHFIPWELINAA
jgi:hypothetical protein